MLAPGAARSKSIDPQVLLLDLDIHVIGELRPDEQRREGGVAGRPIEWRNAHEPVDTGFGGQKAEGVTPEIVSVALLTRFIPGW